MDPYHWPKQRAQPTTTPAQPPSQSPPSQQPQPQPSLRTSAAPSFLSQPLMSSGFPTFAHPSHPPPPAPPPFQALHHSQNVRDTIVPHPHSYQNVQNPLAVSMQHPLPQLSQLHHHSINSQTTAPQNQPHLQIQHPHIQHSQQLSQSQQPPPPQQQQQQQTQQPQQQPQQTQQQPPPSQQQSQQQQQQQQPQQQQQTQQQHQPPSSQQPPPAQHSQPQSSQPHHRTHPQLHPPPHQQQRSISIQPPPRQLSSPPLAQTQTRALHSPHSRDASSGQHIPSQSPINPQVIAQQLSHLAQPPQQQQQQLPQRTIQQTSQQQQPRQHQQQQQQQQHAQQQHQPQQYRQHPQHHRQQPLDSARVVYDNSSVYRLSQPQQPYYNPYSTSQQHVQPQQLSQHPPIYSSISIPTHEYQQQQPSVALTQETSARPLPSQRMPSMHQQPQPTAQHQHQPQPQMTQQQQSTQHMQQSQRQHQKLVTPLQPQPMQMVQISHTQPQQPQDGQPHHHMQHQTGDQVHRQSIPSPQQQQSHQLPHSQQPRHMAQTQPIPPGPARSQLPERRPTPSQIHPPAPQGQVHMASNPIPTTMQLQQHQHQMQRQVLPGQPMQPRDRQHTMQPLMSQQPKSTHHQVMQQQSEQPGKLPQPQHLAQQSAQSTEQGMLHHPVQPIQDAVSKQPPQTSRGLARTEMRVASVAAGERQSVKQEQVPEQSGAAVRQLKVEDALAYLEQVKSQFANNPGVYNHFLDIMKEFKANTIDTAEVITRVSALFQGHRKLILGFNTFLPPGYRIELRSDPTTGCVTGFSSPGGMFFPLSALNSTQPDSVPDSQQQQAPYNQQAEIPRQAPHVPPMAVDPSVQHVTPHGRHRAAQSGDARRQSQHPGMGPGFDRGEYHQTLSAVDKDKPVGIVSQSQQTMSVGQEVKGQPMQHVPNDSAAAALAERFGSPSQGMAVPGKPIEFDQAVTYVNKIKSRFSDDQQVYKTFLGILQTYQKEQKSIKEVYKQVSHLFRDHEDLLREFSNFLPEQPQQRQTGTSSQRVAADAVSGRGKGHLSHVKQQPTLEGTTAENASAGFPGSKSKDKPTKAPGRGRPGKPGTGSLGTTGGISKPTTSARQKGAGQEKKGRRTAASAKKTGLDSKAGLAVAGLIGHAAGSEGAKPELEFFDELRSLLGPEGQQNYSEFIKCLSLFSQEIICGDELMRLADGLLNHRKPLTDAFRAFLDQSDPRATQTAVEILRRAKGTADDMDGTGPSVRMSSAPPVINTPEVRERLRDLPRLVGIGGSTGSAPTPGSRSPKLNPLYRGKPLSQIGRDFGTELAGTSSYVTLPADVVQMQCSGMTADDRTVLNHMFVSRSHQMGHKLIDDDPTRNGLLQKRIPGSSTVSRVTQGSMGALPSPATDAASPKAGRRKGTGSLSIEDQRIELEVMIARAKTTVQKLEQLVKGEIRNVSNFSAVDFKPIELVYKDASYDMIDVLRSNPNVTAPVILQRLQQRLADWRTSQKKMEQLWKSSRFSGVDRTKEGPRTWRRSELKDELMLDNASAVQTTVEQKSVDIAQPPKVIDCELVCEDENLSVICDILWYAFEWEAETVETADKALEFVERIYGVIQKGHRKGISAYVDEHLYVYLRLLTETSQRVRYVLEHNYDGLTTESLVQKVKDVLGGTVSLPAYDDHCRKLYGDSGEWTTFLSDFPLVCKRLAETALAVPQMRTANELLHLAEESVQSEDSSNAGDGDSAVKEEKTDVSIGKPAPQASIYSPTQRLRTAMKTAALSRDEVFKIKVLRYVDAEAEPASGAAQSAETKFILRMRHVSRETAAQFERFNRVEILDEQKISSPLTKYIRRAKKRKRYADFFSGHDEQEGTMYRSDGLDVRVKDDNRERMYVMGTEEFLMRPTFVRRVAARLTRSESQSQRTEKIDGSGKAVSTT